MIPSNQFFYGSGSGGVPSVLQPWYDSLIVKPSEGLWTDLKIMADGMAEDGDWAEMDLISVNAAMETDEQRLRPFKTTSGNDFTKVGAPTLNFEGFQNPSPGNSNYLWMNFVPSINGVKFTQNNAYIAIYGETNGDSDPVMGAYSTTTSAVLMTIDSSNISTRVNNAMSAINDDSLGGYEASKTGLAVSVKRFYSSVIRLSSTTVRSYMSGTYSNITSYSSNGVVDNNLALLGVHFGGDFIAGSTACKIRTCVIGSSSIDSDRVAARLNTFFAARGLSIANY